MPAGVRHATTAVPSAATATRGLVAFSPAVDSAWARPQRPDALQVAAITRPSVAAHAAVTAERPSTAITGFALPRPGIDSAVALPNADLVAAAARTVQVPCD